METRSFTGWPPEKLKNSLKNVKSAEFSQKWTDFEIFCLFLVLKSAEIAESAEERPGHLAQGGFLGHFKKIMPKGGAI